MHPSRPFAIAAALTLVGCGTDDGAARRPGTDSGAAAGSADAADSARTATRTGETTGFDTPESVRYDPELDVYFVSNINGNPGDRDNNGYIARVHPDSLGTITRIVTDTNIRFGADGSTSNPGRDRIFRIADGKARVVAEGDSLGNPNGIAWDEQDSRFIIGGFGSPAVMSWRPGDDAPRVLATGPGQYDGVEVLRGGDVVITSWADSALHVLHGGTLHTIATGIPAPADLGVDTRRNRLLVPQFNDGLVSYWQY